MIKRGVMEIMKSLEEIQNLSQEGKSELSKAAKLKAAVLLSAATPQSMEKHIETINARRIAFSLHGPLITTLRKCGKTNMLQLIEEDLPWLINQLTIQTAAAASERLSRQALQEFSDEQRDSIQALSRKLVEVQDLVTKIKNENQLLHKAMDVAATEKSTDGYCPVELGDEVPGCDLDADGNCKINGNQPIECWKAYWFCQSEVAICKSEP